MKLCENHTMNNRIDANAWRKFSCRTAICRNDLRLIALKIATTSSLVFLADLKTKGMTTSARGTTAELDNNVRKKRS